MRLLKMVVPEYSSLGCVRSTKLFLAIMLSMQDRTVLETTAKL